MSSVSLQTFTGFYVFESSVMSSIRAQVHVTICKCSDVHDRSALDGC